ncbi:N-acetyltransferase [uncultured Bacteroides sp.]|uniref:GNAT family N-acetyltransferase n=1 Tax=uncultured Bacteroides sp. TaxID=162156 RepID=UPI002AABBD86|nr:N-acetyltransferase [uncultured Bacteroides sp.]
MKMEVKIEQTSLKDYSITENITREAFWNLYNPGCSEHFILHLLRESASYIKELDCIAIVDKKIVGHIISTKAKVIDTQGVNQEVLCIGPFAVLPEFQKHGIGSKLMNYSITTAKKLGYKGMILFGNPDYYHRFGFINAEKFKIATRDNQNFEPFMALELHEKGLTDVHGRFFEDEAFSVKEEDVNEFDRMFPQKEKGNPQINISQYEIKP